MGAEAAIDGRTFAVPARKAPTRRLVNLLRKWHLMKPEPTSSELCAIALKKAVTEAGLMRLDAALAMADKALIHEQDDIQAIVIKGLIYMEKGNPEMAAAEFKKATETAKRMSKAAKNGMIQMDCSIVNDYISMRRDAPVGGINHIAYIPAGQALVSLSISAFLQAERDFGFAVRFSTKK
jgi:tetratricopeptide (TPR) repeat protein